MATLSQTRNAPILHIGNGAEMWYNGAEAKQR